MKKAKHLLPALFLLLSTAAFSQTLENMEKELRLPGAGNDGGGGGGSNNSSAFWLDLLFQIGFYPTYGLLFGFDGELPANARDFNAFPYANAYDGLYLHPEDVGKRMNLQLVGHLQTNEDAVFGGYLQARFSPNRAISIDVNRLQLFEALENGGTDQLSVTNFNLQFNRVRHEQFHLWWGGGLMLLDRELMYGSPSLSAGFTWFVKKPLSVYADTQFGWPNGVFARQHQARVQMHLDRFMVYAGYQGTRTGDVRLPNWAIGTGVWF